ncbi:MAG: sulfotransferase [Moorea sp. SIO2I5]|nr:sulfotransferase [Moorena sp. SIO2I5]
MRSNRPILVTGSNRSGSTWIGKTISYSPYVRYIHEPFNVAIAEGTYSKKLPRWFHYVTPQEQECFQHYIKQVINIPNNLIQELSVALNQGKIRPTASKIVRYYFPGFLGVRPLVKDPIAIFSTEWLATQFDMDVVVIIRHPAAYVWSVLKDPTHMHSFKSVFIEQPKLLEKLSDLETEIVAAIDETMPLWQRAAVFWKAIYAMVVSYRKQYPNWLFYRYEDLALAPLEGFRSLCQDLNLEFTDNVEQIIKHHAINELPEEQDLNSHVKRFRSDKHVYDWKQFLEQEQILAIRHITEPIASEFYGEGDW